MMPLRQLNVAVIGDEALVNGLRLAGVTTYCMVKEDSSASEVVRDALTRCLSDPNLGTVVILEDYVKHARDLVTRLRRGRQITPVIIEVPSRFGTTGQDIRAYYKAFVREAIGFDIEI